MDPSAALASARFWRDTGNDVLLIGIIVEIVIDIFWHKEPSRRWLGFISLKGVAVLLAGVLVAVGVWLERVEGNSADDIADGIRQVQQSKILSLETCLAARRISSDQQKAISEKLRRYGATVFDAAIGPRDDPEPLYLLRSIYSSLVAAGWKPTAWTTGDLLTEAPMPPVGETMVTNVIIDVGLTHWAKLGEAATALAQALTAVGIDAIADTKPTSIDTDAIHVRIGRRLCFAEPPRA